MKEKIMKKGKTRIATVTAACLLIAAMGIGGILAYLMDETEWLDNDIELGNIAHGEEFTITETTGTDYTIIPGQDITKDPVVVADATDENVDSYVFLRVSNGSAWDWADDHMSLIGHVGEKEDVFETGICPEWTYLGEDGEGDDQVFYASVSAGSRFENHILVDDKITVGDYSSDDISPSVFESCNLNFICYGIQQAGFDDLMDAYREVRGYPIL